MTQPQQQRTMAISGMLKNDINKLTIMMVCDIFQVCVFHRGWIGSAIFAILVCVSQNSGRTAGGLAVFQIAKASAAQDFRGEPECRSLIICGKTAKTARTVSRPHLMAASYECVSAPAVYYLVQCTRDRRPGRTRCLKPSSYRPPAPRSAAPI